MGRVRCVASQFEAFKPGVSLHFFFPFGSNHGDHDVDPQDESILDPQSLHGGKLSQRVAQLFLGRSYVLEFLQMVN